ATLTAGARTEDVTATRGVVLTTIQGSAGALAKISPNDAPMSQIVRAVSNELQRGEPSGDPVTTSPRHETVPGEQFY
ncbi:MAG TPA: hypothetical protein VFQ39_00770, partial [Longimicrobium sp.]|nr:hypothetical protein [Longimicrobium sp.]